MNQDRDGASRTPKSSSSSNPSGTHALRITIEPEQLADPSAAAPADAASTPDAPEADHAAPPVSDEQAAIAVAAELGEPVTDAVPVAVTDEPDAAPADEVAAAAPVEPDLADVTAAPAEVAALPSEAVDAPGMDEQQPASAVADARMRAQEPQFVMAEPSNPAPVAEAAAAEPVVEAVASAGDLPEAARETLADTVAKSERTVVAAAEMPHALSMMMDDARHDAALIGRKLMEFVQANFENNIEMARDYAGARSVPEIVNVHTAYVRRQIDLLSRQAEEFRALTSDLTAKRVSKIQSRLKA